MIAIWYRSITFVAFDYAEQEAAACKVSPFESLDKTANSDNKMKVFFFVSHQSRNTLDSQCLKLRHFLHILTLVFVAPKKDNRLLFVDKVKSFYFDISLRSDFFLSCCM